MTKARALLESLDMSRGRYIEPDIERVARSLVAVALGARGRTLAEVRKAVINAEVEP